ncbi:disulfide bond formation protein DsbA [Nocardia uniformis]|uniref:Disulfide bond formation protein DsbA n=1 Tax=Nocardia uniformis TaxID=53432 RepID=A0A849BWE9_9NOCA|nr:DsbA family protein [Nocardia uniformis]NNH69316.1 disulfide bond formation protein DsbA [Nocardia uniformis]
MAAIDLYIDPVCPFGWVTAQWLLAATRAAEVPVELKQMSLAALNEGQDVDAHHQPMIDSSRRLGRLFAAVSEKHGAEGFTRLYRAVGTSVHVHRNQLTDKVIAEILAELGMDPTLLDILDDAGVDGAVASAHAASQQALGGRGGSPIIAIDGHGFFGPVLTRIPDPDNGAALLHAVIAAARTPGFAVLQRPYSGPPATEQHEENN